MEELEDFLYKELNLDDLMFIERRDQGFFFTGIDNENGDEKTILLTNTNKVFVEGEKQDVTIPFNVFSLEV